jgi:hypothetical protein
MLEKTEGPIKNGQWRDIGNAGHTRLRSRLFILTNTKQRQTKLKTQYRKLKR